LNPLKTNERQLFDLGQDFGETKDLAATEPGKVHELPSKLTAWRKQIGAQMPTPNPAYDPERSGELAGRKK